LQRSSLILTLRPAMVEVLHQRRGVYVTCRTNAGEHRANTRVEKRSFQTGDPLLAFQSRSARVSGGQRHQICIEVQGSNLTSMQQFVVSLRRVLGHD